MQIVFVPLLIAPGYKIHKGFAVKCQEYAKGQIHCAREVQVDWCLGYGILAE